MMLHQPSPGDTAGVTKSRTIADGDLVIVYERIDAMKSYFVDAQKTYHGRFGLFPVQDWIGKPFGSRVYSKGTGGGQQGWIYLLAPTPELWTMVLRHRTQILYAADISIICMYLELRPGCTVLESGTGSGSLTHALARAIAPTGHVHTFDFHQQRASEAEAEFNRHGLGKLVAVQHRNIEEHGFPEELHGKADALFLDLPGPWKARSLALSSVVKSAEACLRPDGIFCAFSPCIEQVQRTCEALASCSFTAPRTMECLLRSYEVSNEKMVIDLSRAEEATLESRKRKRQTKETKDSRGRAVRAKTNGAMRGRDAAQQSQTPRADPLPGSESKDQHMGSPAADSVAPEAPEQAPEPASAAGAAPAAASAATAEAGAPEVKAVAAAEQRSGDGKVFQVLALPTADARGHTGYLTFARRLVEFIEP
ncbi:g2307 [Coccomyxa viridis]|uniref:tRNA (adenine(58)-N(1))-methyltransferase n=1 Tax=Coccomyxa viridis TaxID=1274662 RepID=A0ABP1FQ99_9CHLO